MPRNTLYRKTWTAANDYNIRITFVPAHEDALDFTTAPVVDLGDGTVISIENLEWSFKDDLCVGLVQEPAMKITVNTSELPADLITYLSDPIKNPTDETSKSNMVILEWDILNNFDSTTHEIIHLGIQSAALTQELEIGKAGDTLLSFTTQGALTHTLQRCSFDQLRKLYGYSPTTPEFGTGKGYLVAVSDYDSYISGVAQNVPVSERWSTCEYYIPGGDKYFYMVELKWIFEMMRQEMCSKWITITRQNGNTWDLDEANLTTDKFDFQFQKLYGDITTDAAAVHVYKAQEAIADMSDRNGAILAHDEIFIPFVTHVDDNLTKAEWIAFVNDADPTIGGIWNPQDSQSWYNQFDSFAEWAKTMSESTFTKWTPVYTYTAGVFKCDLKVFRAFESPYPSADANLNLLSNSMTEKVKVEVGYTATGTEIGTAAGLQAHVTMPKYSVVDGSLPSQQQFSIKNVPLHITCDATDAYAINGTWLPRDASRAQPSPNEGWEFQFHLPFPATMMMYEFDLASIAPYMKVNERVIIDADGVDLASLTGPNDVASIHNDNYLIVREWLITRQTDYSMSRAVAEGYLKLLGDRRNWFIREAAVVEGVTANLTPFAIGNYCLNAAPSTHTHLPGAGIITNYKLDVLTGLAELVVFHPGCII